LFGYFDGFKTDSRPCLKISEMFSDMKFFANPRKFLQAGCRPARNVNAEWQNKSRRLGALSFFKQGLDAHFFK